MIDYTELKNGEVITMIDEYDITRIIIVNKVIGNHRLYTYVELDDVGDVFFEKYEPGVYHDLNNCVCRKAEDEEKYKLYNAIGKHFTEEYDKDWYKYFTDSSYFDIQDYLLNVFRIKVREYDDDLIYPDFINEIHTYIWDKLCEAMEVPYTVKKPEMVNKQEFIEKAWQWLKAHIKIETISYNDVWDVSEVEILATDFDTIDEMEESFRKIMGE